MLLTHETQAKYGQLQPAEGYVDLPLPFLDKHLAALGKKAKSEGRTIGQIIRTAIGHYLAGGCDRPDSVSGLGNSQLNLPLDGSGVVEALLLLPAARLAELESLAAQERTTAAVLIRHVICYSHLAESSIQSSTTGSIRDRHL